MDPIVIVGIVLAVAVLTFAIFAGAATHKARAAGQTSKTPNDPDGGATLAAILPATMMAGSADCSADGGGGGGGD